MGLAPASQKPGVVATGRRRGRAGGCAGTLVAGAVTVAGWSGAAVGDEGIASVGRETIA